MYQTSSTTKYQTRSSKDKNVIIEKTITTDIQRQSKIIPMGSEIIISKRVIKKPKVKTVYEESKYTRTKQGKAPVCSSTEHLTVYGNENRRATSVISRREITKERKCNCGKICSCALRTSEDRRISETKYFRPKNARYEYGNKMEKCIYENQIKEGQIKYLDLSRRRKCTCGRKNGQCICEQLEIEEQERLRRAKYEMKKKTEEEIMKIIEKEKKQIIERERIRIQENEKHKKEQMDYYKNMEKESMKSFEDEENRLNEERRRLKEEEQRILAQSQKDMKDDKGKRKKIEEEFVKNYELEKEMIEEERKKFLKKLREDEEREKKRKLKDKNFEQQKKLLEDQMKYYMEQRNKIKTGEAYEAKRKKRAQYYDGNYRDTELKTFHMDYVQKKYKVSNQPFMERTTVTKTIRSSNNIYSQNYNEMCDINYVDDSICPACKKLTVEHC
jgi:hypothetical protein